MIEPVISVAVIEQHAIETADAGRSPSLCPYPKDSPAAERWHELYYARRKAMPAAPENKSLQISQTR